MRIILINKYIINKIDIEDDTNNSYWITDKESIAEKKIIQIKLENGQCEAISSKYAKIINPLYNSNTENDRYLQTAILKNGDIYAIYIEDTQEIQLLYYDNEDIKSFKEYNIINTNEITIGSDNNNHVIYNNNVVSGKHARIFKFNGTWFIENYDSNYGTFVNNISISTKRKKLFNGDIVFIMGLRLIMINNNIYINNPCNKVRLDNRYFEIVQREKNIIINKDTDENELIDDDNINYFYEGPRIINEIKTEKIEIDPPPQLQELQGRNLIFSFGPIIAMGAVMIISLVSTIQGRVTGSSSIFETVISLLTTIAMLIGMLVFPILSIRYEEKSRKKYLKKRQTRYKEYLNKKREEIKKIKEKNKEKLLKNYISSDECAKIILEKNSRLWERDIEDKDFLTLRLGIGETSSNIEISYVKKGFSMEDDQLLDELYKIIEDSKNIEDAPLTISLYNKNIFSIVSEDNDFINKYMKNNIIIQLIALHSYANLKLVFLLNNNTSFEWEYVKMLPHVFDDTKQIRFFADNYEDINELSKYMQEQFESRLKEKNQENKSYNTYYLIITDDYQSIQNIQFIQNLCNEKENMGFSMLCLSNDLHKLPKRSKTFAIINKNNGTIIDSTIPYDNKKMFKTEALDTFFFEKIIQALANIPIMINSNNTYLLPKNYTFLEMYNSANIEELNILKRWKNNNTTLSLKAPIGVDGKGELIFLDIHEKYHGPHGLIAGSTGSGKSEFIITYLLSMAINYHPDDVNFLLIDYKGGGLAGAFKKNGIKLPHIVGIITNLDRSGLQRAFISIQSELRRRQILFNEARDMTEKGTIDIYKYQQLYHEGVVSKPVSHLVIVCDEFAELKQQQPDFMEELISVSRIGRSLGVHLILATQKPAGVVNDQIRSNSKFAICLKVQDTADSLDIINRPDGAYLVNPGQFYMQVGANEYHVLGQSGWAGATYFPNKTLGKKIDNSLNVISNIGSSVKVIRDISKQKLKGQGEQLTNIVKYICKLAKEENVNKDNLWLDTIPANIYVKDLREKYKLKNKNMEVVLGEYDDPYNQRQEVLKIDLYERENILIYGNAESGKETLLSTFIYDTITNYTSNQVQFYILDFGSEALKIYKNAPHIGDIVFMGENEKIDKFFDMIQKEIKIRKNILSDYNGDYNTYLSKKNTMPLLYIIINNHEVFDENYSMKYDDILLSITRDGTKCGIIFMFTTSTGSSMKYRLMQNFKNKIVLQLNNDDDFNVIIDKVVKIRPSRIFGRGLITIDDNVYEFQTAKICNSEDYNTHIENTITNLNKENNIKAKPIPVVPNVLKLQDIADELKDITEVPIGMIKKDLSIYTFDFAKKFMTIITSNDLKNAIEYSSILTKELKQLKNVKVETIDAEKIREEKRKTFKEITNELFKEINQKMNKENDIFTLYIIIGIKKLIAEEDFDEIQFAEMLDKAKKSERYSFLIIDNVDRLREITFKDWYQKNIEENSGIWIGNDVENQTLINLNFNNKDIDNRCGKTYGYVITSGNAVQIKLAGMKEIGDESG